MYMSVNEVAQQLGVYPGRIYRAHLWGKVPEPVKVGKARLYTEADVALLSAYFNNNKRPDKET